MGVSFQYFSFQENVAFGSYFILGAAFLAPWNAYLTAIDYFTEVYVSHESTIYHSNHPLLIQNARFNIPLDTSDT
jgi:hypothetical protein